MRFLSISIEWGKLISAFDELDKIIPGRRIKSSKIYLKLKNRNTLEVQEYSMLTHVANVLTRISRVYSFFVYLEGNKFDEVFI